MLLVFPSNDTQQHCLTCPKLTNNIQTNNIKYEYIFGNLSQQMQVVEIYSKILERRQRMMDDQDDQGLPGLTNTGP